MCGRACVRACACARVRVCVGGCGCTHTHTHTCTYPFPPSPPSHPPIHPPSRPPARPPTRRVLPLPSLQRTHQVEDTESRAHDRTPQQQRPKRHRFQKRLQEGDKIICKVNLLCFIHTKLNANSDGRQKKPARRHRFSNTCACVHIASPQYTLLGLN